MPAYSNKIKRAKKRRAKRQIINLQRRARAQEKATESNALAELIKPKKEAK